jgi:hypothetical protein
MLFVGPVLITPRVTEYYLNVLLTYNNITLSVIITAKFIKKINSICILRHVDELT